MNLSAFSDSRKSRRQDTTGALIRNIHQTILSTELIIRQTTGKHLPEDKANKSQLAQQLRQIAEQLSEL